MKRRGFIGGVLAFFGIGAGKAATAFDPMHDPDVDARRVFLDGKPDADAVIDGLSVGCHRTYRIGPRGEIQVYESNDGFAWAYRGDIPKHRLTDGSELFDASP